MNNVCLGNGNMYALDTIGGKLKSRHNGDT